MVAPRHREWNQGVVATPVGFEVPGDPAQHEDVGHPVGHRVEEGTPHRRRSPRLRHRAVQKVVEPGDEEQDDREVEVAASDRHRSAWPQTPVPSRSACRR